MKSAAVLGLTGLAANVLAHPQRYHANGASLDKRDVDLSKFRMPGTSEYTASAKAKLDPAASIIQRRGDYVSAATELVKTVFPGAEFRVVDDHYVGTDGLAHVNFKQVVHGIDIDNADFNVNVSPDGTIFSYGNSFYKGKTPSESPLHKRKFTDPVNALNGVVDILKLSIKTTDAKAEAKEGTEIYTFKDTSGAVSDPEAKLVYLTKDDGSLALTWRVETDVVDNWLLTYIDADNSKDVHGVVDYVSDFATLEVYPWRVNDPTEGARSVETDPWNIDASPYTWFGDGSKNYTTLWGNNAVAQTNHDGHNNVNDFAKSYRPTSSARNFEYDYSPSQSNKDDYQDASITQLFYTANTYHDLLYTLGFTEAAGNFQTDNSGKGGKGNDFVVLNSQDGSGTNNANFASPPDGSRPRMRMYMWTQTSPQRDCAFDSDVILHEFTHGLSTRLTGGPANSGCLNGLESGGMGEGWSDFMAAAILIKSTDTRTKDFPVGVWVYDNPKGIRSYPYSTSMKRNPYTYADANQKNEVHAMGEIWANTLYEVFWNLADAHGITDDKYPVFDAKGVPTDGRYLAMKLVMGGMSIQPCNPNMVSARDAILDADKSLTGSANKCLLWKAFAKRGLGTKARYNGGRNRVEDFTVPAGC
ncbi:elastinolytic metalloproteinase Mep [Metarhizium album ARSEF 1941]|uniref:Extracellular metalloproteinase n=1 Tax=Metarhizium album (strain ARSEF 1941) TaxID=1081103 RepID=A0A0B2WQK1_METAS|nr:elastinolytic metalloproteinase Mep [Metarhizium album ARSEF 1941]KHN95929.1 elastinolytic metalloproteinase Mep [Metarhizium album ARSEF 1941]